MSDKQVVLDALQRMPEAATLDEISEEIAILAAIRRGEEAVKAGRVVLHEEVKRWTPAELRKLPAAQRDAILEAAAALAESEYRHNPELTAFEAFGPDDLYGDSSDTATR